MTDGRPSAMRALGIRVHESTPGSRRTGTPGCDALHSTSMTQHSFLRFTCVVLATASLTSTALVVTPPIPGSGSAVAAEISTRNWSPTEVLEGLLFLQGDFGRELVKSGALGPLSNAQEAALEQAMNDGEARRLARDVSKEVQARSPLVVRSLVDALGSGDPMATDAAMNKLSKEFLDTPTMKRVSDELPAGPETYVPGEDREGRALLVVVVAGAVLVITVAAVGVGVLAAVSTVAIGSTKVAGKNAIRKSSGPAARAQAAELTASAIRVFHGR